MVAKQIAQRPIRADGETSRTGEIVFRDNRILHFIVIADVVGGHAVDDGLDLLAIAIVVEVGRGRAGHRDQTILGVVVQYAGLSIHVTRGQSTLDQVQLYC